MFQIYLQRPPPPSPLRNRVLSHAHSLESELAAQRQPPAHQQQRAELAHQNLEDAGVNQARRSIGDEIEAGQI